MPIDHLLTLLACQRDVLSRLLTLNRSERACLLESRLDSLDAIVQEQAELLAQQSLLSARITNHLTKLNQQCPVALERVSLTALLPYLSADTAPQVRASLQDITAMADELQREGRVNWHLAQQALRYVDFTLKLIGNAKDGPLPYVPRTQAAPTRAVQMLMDSCA